MVSPNIDKKSENILTLTGNAKRLFQVIYREKNKEEKDNEDIPKIKVSALISKMAFYYEKIRNSVDYKEEYLLKKNAIERILKRQIVIEGVVKITKSEEISKHLLTELIRAGYLPNDVIPEEKQSEIAEIIEKYLKLRNYSLARIRLSSRLIKEDVGKTKNEMSEKNAINHWIIALVASEIEENLGIDKVKKVVVNSMYEVLTKNIKLPSDLPYEKDLKIQIYLGIYRNFLKFDKDMLSLILFKYFNSKWKKPTNEDIARIAQNIITLREVVNKQLDHPLTGQLNRIIRRYTVFFTILAEVINEDPVGTYDSIKNDSKAFPRKIKNICNKKYKQIKLKLWRSAARSIIYIFLTKSILAIILEVPATKWFGEEVNFISLGINIVFPAFLLFVIILFTRVPSNKNTNKIIEGIDEIAFKEDERKDPFILRQPVKRGKLINMFFGIAYSITFFISFGLVVWALNKIHFSWVSIIIFLFFLAFVSFFSVRIRKGVKEYILLPPKENIFSFIADFFYVPIAVAGKWLSEKFSRLNVFVFVLDFIIEAPFKIFIEIADQWTRYVKERKDEIV